MIPLPSSLVVNWCWQSISYSPTLHSVGDDWPPRAPFPPWKQCDPTHPPPQPQPKFINWSLKIYASLLLASFSPPPLFFLLTYEWLHDVPLVITLPSTRVRGPQEGGGVGRGRKASMRILALEKSVCPRMALLIGAAWWHLLTGLTSSYQNPRPKQCKRDLRSERSKWRKVWKVLTL